jgi:hypothetical protein
MNNSLTIFLTLTTAVALAQPPAKPPKQGEIDNQQINVEKSRRIELPAANRVFNKIPSVKQSAEARKLTYEFDDRPLSVADPKITPNVLPPNAAQPDQSPVYTNYLKLGAGNFNTFYGEGFGGTTVGENLAVEGNVRHLSSGIGPVDGKNSATSDTKFGLTAKYGTQSLNVEAGADYRRETYRFYGYRPGTEIPDVEKIKQRLNIFAIRLGIENTDNERAVDYSLKTNLTTLRDLYTASETDWGTNFKGSLGISETISALVAADAYVTQRTDAGIVDNRNLFRVKPTFKYTSSFITAIVGINAVNETDKRLGINRTRAFPVANIDIVPTGNIHFFAGVDGDISRNTLRSLLTENRWLAPQVVLANTVKGLDIYGGAKGEIGGGFTFEGKASYATYRNFYAFNNTWPDTTKFFVLYDGGRANVLTLSGQVGYSLKDKFRSNLKVDVFRYDLDRLEAAWGRPRIAGTWSNAYILNKKLFITADVYAYQGIEQKNFVTNTAYTLPVIVDANLKIDYFLGKQFAAFVSLNNIFGQNYQRYLYYPTQGLNFLAGISYSF